MIALASIHIAKHFFPRAYPAPANEPGPTLAADNRGGCIEAHPAFGGGLSVPPNVNVSARAADMGGRFLGAKGGNAEFVRGNPCRS